MSKLSTLPSFPPLHSHPSRPISPNSAQLLIQTYLTTSQSTPYLLPNAKLLASGPSAQGSSDGGLVLHNLRRVEAGLRGEVLAPSLDIELDGNGNNGEMEGVEYDGRMEGEKVGDMWAEAQDLSEYQREQEEEDGEVGGGQAGGMVVDEGVVEVMGDDGKEKEKENDTEKETVDKESRKAMKAARRKELARAKNEKAKRGDD